MMVFTANPEDYTARGKIITPLKDRIGSEIRTHYPSGRTEAMAITAQEAWLTRTGAGPRAEVPNFVAEVVEEIAFRRVRIGESTSAPASASGCRFPAMENVVSNARTAGVDRG
jgi:magnesium chelatase subunit I